MMDWKGDSFVIWNTKNIFQYNWRFRMIFRTNFEPFICNFSTSIDHNQENCVRIFYWQDCLFWELCCLKTTELGGVFNSRSESNPNENLLVLWKTRNLHIKLPVTCGITWERKLIIAAFTISERFRFPRLYDVLLSYFDAKFLATLFPAEWTHIQVETLKVVLKASCFLPNFRNRHFLLREHLLLVQN